MIKSKSIVLSTLISIIPLGLIVLNILDIYDVMKGKGDYPFSSEFFNRYSIYSSKEVYILYNITFILLLSITIFLTFKKKWKIWLAVLALDILFFFYPLVANT